MQTDVIAEIRAFIAKASGVPSILREALRDLEGSIDVAVIFGSVAKGAERPDSDVDLFIVGSPGYSVVTERLYGVQERLGRRVQTLYFDPKSAVDRASLRKPATRALLSGPKLFVLGDERTLEASMSTEDEHGQKGESRKPGKRRKTRAARR